MIHYKIQDFLTGRYQRVAVNGENSNWEEVTSGIPYIYIGISTCPLIICSIHKWFARSCGFTEAYLFADDTKIFRIITGENDQNILQEDLRKMEDWSNNRLLKFHPEKCKYMKKYSDSQCCWKKYSDFGGGKKNNLIQSFCHIT